MTDPDWATAVPSADVHKLPSGAGTTPTNPFTQQQLLQIGAQLIEQFLQKVLLAIVGFFIPGVSSFEQLANWAHGLSDQLGNIPIIGDFLQAIVDTVISVLTGSSNTGNSIQGIFFAFLTPLQTILGQLGAFGDQFTQLAGQLAGLTGQMQAANANIAALLSATSTSPVGGYDNFNRDTLGAGWTTIVGTPEIRNRAYLQCTHFYAGLYSVVPESDKSGIAFRLDGKLDGICRGIYNSNDTMTNWVGVEVFNDWFGNVSVRIVSGSSPTVRVIQREVSMRPTLQNNTVIRSWYDPAIDTFITEVNNDRITDLDWPDPDGIITHGVGDRRVGAASNCGDKPAYGYQGFGITDFTPITVT